MIHYTLLLRCKVLIAYTPTAAARQTSTVPAPASRVSADALLSAPPDGDAEGEAAALEATEEEAEEVVLTALLLTLLLMLLLMLALLLPLPLELPDTGTVTVTGGRLVGDTVAEAHWFR